MRYIKSFPLKTIRIPYHIYTKLVVNGVIKYKGSFLIKKPNGYELCKDIRDLYSARIECQEVLVLPR